VVKLVAYVLRKQPNISRLQVFKTLHDALGQIENRVVYRVLNTMIEAGTVQCVPGKYDNAMLCRMTV
jgi:Fe2+ or Zn2+ uptake regulation protein